MSAEDWARAIGKLIVPTLTADQPSPVSGGEVISNEWRPLCDVRKTKDSFLLQIEVPGIDPDSIKLSIEGPVLSISGERPTQSFGAGEKPYRSERNYGKFSRAFALPKNVDTGSILATCNHGLLEVRIRRAPRESKGFKIASTDTAALQRVEPSSTGAYGVGVEQQMSMRRTIPISTSTGEKPKTGAPSTSPSKEGMPTDIGVGQGISSGKSGFGAPSDIDSSLQPQTFRPFDQQEEGAPSPSSSSHIHEPKDPGLVRDIGDTEVGQGGLGFVQHVQPPHVEPLGKKDLWSGPAFQGESLKKPEQKGLQKEMDRATGMEKLETPNEPLPQGETQSSQV